MLRLILFAACEQLIVGQNNNTSLINVLEVINTTLLAEVPPDAAIPMKWHVVSLWQRTEDSDEPKQYEQRIDIVRADGVVIGGGAQEFTVTNDHLNFRNHLEIQGFPVGVAGTCSVKLHLREAGESNEWREAADLPILVAHIMAERPDEEARPETSEAG